MKALDRRHKNRRNREKTVELDRREARRRTKQRRNELRVPLELWMEEVVGEDVYFRRTGNVGLGGVYFDNAIPHELGTEVTLKFTLPGDREMVVARGTVINKATTTPKLGMRIRFISIEGNGKERIRQFIDNL